MNLILTEPEIRVLGVLIEKSLTQTGSYPLTLNAITLGANQLQNRDPILTMTEHDVSLAIRSLQHKKLAVQAPPSAGARANRFEHKVVEAFHWDRRDQAVMAELMLRGRQTAGELRNRASRMTPFADVEAVMVTLRGLMAKNPPWIAELAREPGRSANRFLHLLLGEVVEEAAPAPSTEVVRRPETASVRDLLEALTERVARLEERMESLTRTVDEAPSTESR